MQEKKESLPTNIKGRVIEVANFKGISLEKFFLELGVTYGSFKGQNKKSSLNSSVIERLHQMYPDISLEWLISGRGSMTITHNGGGNILGDNNVYHSVITTDKKERRAQRPKDDDRYKDELIAELRNHISSLKSELDRKDAIISHLMTTTHK